MTTIETEDGSINQVRHLELVLSQDREYDVSAFIGGNYPPLPSIIIRAGYGATKRFLEFFTVNIRNRHTRRAYTRAALQFLAWCEERGVTELAKIEPMLIAAYIEKRSQEREPQTVKQELAGIRMLFDWLVIGQIMPTNPASAVRGPRYSYSKGKTPVLDRDGAKQLLTGIDISHVVGLRDRALIALMIYSFARIGAALGMCVGDYYQNGKRWWIRLHEKGGKFHEVPVHHLAEEYLDAYLNAAGIQNEIKTPLFRTTRGLSRKLTGNGLQEAEALAMIKRRADGAGFAPSFSRTICCHTMRATGITAYLENGGAVEHAQKIAAHESLRTTKLYDRRDDKISLNEIERIVL